MNYYLTKLCFHQIQPYHEHTPYRASYVETNDNYLFTIIFHTILVDTGSLGSYFPICISITFSGPGVGFVL